MNVNVNVVRFVRVIRVPACARVSRVSRVCPGSPRCLSTGTGLVEFVCDQVNLT